MSEMEEPDDGERMEAQYGLIMPFVVCEDHGGPYESHAFVAGWICGIIDARLSSDLPVHPQWVPPGALPQLELIAMRNGYLMESEPWEEFPDAHALVSFTRASEDLTL